jgi:hypothetical protein
VNISVVTDSPPELSAGTVNPIIGPANEEGSFNFSVTYTDPDNDPPEEIQVKVGPPGERIAHDLEESDPSDTNFRNGKNYHIVVSLNTGEHSYVFSCRDLFFACATSLLPGPVAYRLQSFVNPALGIIVTVNWTQQGMVAMQKVPSPGAGPADLVTLSQALMVSVESGEYTSGRVQMEYEVGHLMDPDTITLLWFDPDRAIWVPATSQDHDAVARTVEANLPVDAVALTVFGQLNSTYQNYPPHLEITYNVKDAFVDEELWFDASLSTDPDGGVLLFYWDFVDDGKLGPWTPGVRASHTYTEKGTYQVVLRAIDGQEEYLLFQNISIRPEKDYQPGPFDNTDALFLLGSLLVLAFGIAIAFRLHRPKTYDDLFGKAYRKKEADEYSQLFRKLTQEDLAGEPEDELDEDGQDEDEADEDELEGDEPDEEDESDRKAVLDEDEDSG